MKTDMINQPIKDGDFVVYSKGSILMRGVVDKVGGFGVYVNSDNVRYFRGFDEVVVIK